MVAAGGSGGAGYAPGAPGGTLKGKKIGCNNCNYAWYQPYNFHCDSYPEEDSDQTTQTSGTSELGVGGQGKEIHTVPGSGGGGGWQGGVSSGESSGGTDCYYKSIAHSGSSYISGYPGCQPSTINGYIFENYGMISGQKDGDGQVIITTIYECKENCASCSSSDNCFECIEPFKLYNNNCYNPCPDGTSESGSICEVCKDSNCFKCPSSADLCEICNANFFLLIENGVTSCVEKCPDGKIGIDGKCIDCNQKCSTCSISVDYCDSCQGNNYQFNGDCYSECNVLNDESKNDFYGKDNIIFNNLTFRNCKATFGGAVVIYSIYDLNNVSFNYCEFHSNRVNEKNLNKNNDFQGGSGAFLCAKNMHVYKCNFVENKGSLGALKLYNKFNEDKTKMKRNNYLDYNQKSIVVSNCNFVLNDDSKTSIYYENGKHHSMIDIIDCNYYSKKNRQNSHIDGKEWNLDSSKVSIKSCNFQKANSHLYATLTIMLIILAVISIVISLVIHNVNHLKFQI